MVEKAGILDVCVIPGNIRFNNVNFDVVIEDLGAERDTKATSSSQGFERDCHRWKVIHDFAEDEEVLLMRTSIDFLSSKMPHLLVSYTQCINEIASSLDFSRFKADYPVISRETVADGDIWTRCGLLVVDLAMQQISEILTRQATVGDRKLHFADIAFTRNPPWQICSEEPPKTPEILFFSTHPHFLPSKTILILLEDSKIEESLFTLLQRTVRREISIDEMVRRVRVKGGTDLDMSKVEKFATGIVSELPGLRFMTRARA